MEIAGGWEQEVLYWLFNDSSVYEFQFINKEI